ncbi:MAG: D-alanyl-D-alanine carboxypeptidase [Lachnospiraceae bacterium]|nr:D-alanyl-D-alanine carboxypeptidase [Lachnospiraceae bacterium]
MKKNNGNSYKGKREVLYKKKVRKIGTACAVFLMLFSFFSMNVCADETSDLEAQRQARMNEVVTTNQIEGWPQGPAIGAEGAILMEAKTGAILYAKNIDEKLYPASTTKIMTGLLAYENCKLDEMVTFSHDAVFSVSRSDSNIGMDVGESIPMNKALEGMMILSANEVANAIAEHVSGSMDDFAVLMNKKAEEIGCTNTHFTNPNGLHDENHYTTCRDLAMIAKYYFQYDYLAGLSREPACEFVATETQPDSFRLNTKNMLVKGRRYQYDALVGSKTGYTSEARQTLVSAAKKDGLELICVIMKEESPYQFEDTVALFDYGFENFKKVNIADHSDESNMLSTGFFTVGQDVFGSNESILMVDPTAVVILPKNADFSSVRYDLSANNAGMKVGVAKVNYLFNGNLVGTANLSMNAESATLFDEFADKDKDVTAKTEDAENTTGGEGDTTAVSDGEENNGTDAEAESEKLPTTNRNKNGIFINVKIALIALGAIAAFTVILVIIKSIISQYQFAKKRREVIRRHRERKRKGKYGE